MGEIQVTAVVQDVNGNIYQNGFGNVSLVVPGNATQYPLYNGSVFQTQIPFDIDSHGNLGGPGGLILVDNNSISDGLTPSGTQWEFNICMKTQPPYYGLPCFNLTLPITGSSPQDITAQVQAASALLPTGGGPFPPPGSLTIPIDATLPQFAAADMGASIAKALAYAYSIGGAEVTAQGFSCPTHCHIGTANLTVGDGINPVKLILPTGTITRDTISASGLSSQIFYNSESTIIGQGINATIISGPTDVTAVAQAPVGSVSNATIYDLTIADTGTIATNSVTLQVGGPAVGGLASPNAPNVLYTNNILQNVPGDLWAGTEGHVAIFTRALSAADIASLYATGSNAGTGYIAAVESLHPLSYWPGDDTSGTTMVDVVGGRDGTYVGGVTLGVGTPIPGDSVGHMPVYDGVTGLATLPPYNWFPQNDFTVMFWVLPTNQSGNQAFLEFEDPTDANGCFFNDRSSAWGGMYAAYHINGNVIRTIFNRTSVGTGTLTFVVFTQQNGLVNLYLNGAVARTGGDVSSSTFANISTSGADVGVLLNGQDGCVCYNRFYNMKPSGRSIGIQTINNSGYGFGVNSNYWQSPQPGGAVGIYDSGGTINEYSGVPDLENNLWNSGLNAAVAAEVTSGFNGTGYKLGDVVTATLGCTVNPTFQVTYIYIGGAGQVGSNYSPTEQALVLVNGGSGCPSGSTDNVATTGGSGTGLKVNVHVSGTAVFLGFATKVGMTYSENGAQIYACGGGNHFEVIGQIGNGSTWKPNLCYGTTTSYGGPASNWWAAPGSAPPGLGLQGTAPYISYGTGLMYDSSSSFSYTPSMSFPANIYSNGPTYNGSAAQTYGYWGNNEWNSGVNKPHSGTVATGKTSFGKIADPSVPVLTAVGGTGTASVAYGLVCSDGNGGHTTVSNPVTTVSGPSALGAFLTMAIASGGGNSLCTAVSTPFGCCTGVGTGTCNYVQGDVGTNVTIAGAAGFGSGGQAAITQVNNGSGSGPVTGISLNAAGSGYVMETFPGSSNPLNRSTTGGTGSGLTITGTTTYIQVAIPHTNGCLQWTVLAGDTSHALQSPGSYATGSTDLSSLVFDCGNAYAGESWATTRNTTGDFLLAASTTPSSSSDGCTAGTIAWDASYVYVCTSGNTWKRTALSSF